MGICCLSNSFSKKKNTKYEKNLNSNNINEFKKAYYNEKDSSNLHPTSATSHKNNFLGVIYTLNKYGIQIKTKEKITHPLKFIFNIYNFKCKMLSENSLYILYIIFDGKEFPLCFGRGNNPKFMFNETFGKEITFEKMYDSFLEIYLYTYKSSLNDKRNLDLMTKAEILSEAQIFSCFKINLLTLALAPEKHDLILIDPKRSRVQLGRISYCVSCKHIEDINITIKKFKINLNNLKYNEIALNLKLENKNYNKEKESHYTENLIGETNENENSTIYEYPFNTKNDQILIDNLSESIAIQQIKDLNNLISEDKSYNTNELSINLNKNNNINNNKDITKNELKNKLNVHGKMSMLDLFNSETSINIFSVQLKNYAEINFSKDKKKEFFMKKIDLPNIAKQSYINNMKNSNTKFELINSYKLIGIVSLNFNKILNDLEEKISKINNRLFQSMSNKKNSLVKTLSGSKIIKFGIEEDLTNRAQSNKNLCDINLDEIQYRIETFIINIFQSENLNLIEEIYWEGDIIGAIELNLELENLPLIRQIRFGVMTETGFELNSIFLYDNLNISNDFPEKVSELIKLKEKFEQERDFSILKKIKSCLEYSLDNNFLYYGFSLTKDLYMGQAVIIGLGLGLFDFLDKIKYEYLSTTFEILKLIVKRSEFDLGTLSVKWFKPRRIYHKKYSDYDMNNDNDNYKSKSSKDLNINLDNEEIEYEFLDDYLIDEHLIEKYLNFHYQLLNYCLNNLSKVKDDKYIGSMASINFTYFYLSVAFFQIPQFRNSFIKSINNSINLKNEKYLKFMNREHYSKRDSSYINSNVNNIIIWDNLFYKRLESSINIYMRKIERNSKESKNINKANKLENINSIKEQLMNIKYITEIKEEKKINDFYIHPLNWYEKLSKRDFVFYDLLIELFENLNILRNKIYMNKSSNLINFKNPELITNFQGIEDIIKIISYDLITKKAKKYPRQIKLIIPKFYADAKVINNIIYILLTTTNAYDTLSVVKVIDILDDLFNKKYNFNDFRDNYLKNEIDCTIIKKAFMISVDSDNSLAVAKFIWFYYKNISILTFHHIDEIINYILLSKNFFHFFFHWSFQIREIFYYFIIFILGYKIKGKIKSKNEINEKNNKSKNYEIRRDSTLFFKSSFSENFLKNEMMTKDEFFFISEKINENMDLIDKLQKMIKKEKYEDIYRDYIMPIHDKNILDKIPKEHHGNIIESIRQYNSVITKFKIWENKIKEEKIPENKIEYPPIDIYVIKDDKIEY
jgi:hypothetical protein